MHRCIDGDEKEQLKIDIANKLFREKDPNYFHHARHKELYDEVKGGNMYCPDCNQTMSTIDIVNKAVQRWKDFLIPGNRAQHNKVRGSWERGLLAVAGEVTRHGQAHPYSWSITIVSLRSKESEECHRSKWKTKLLSMFLAVTCQQASGACQSHTLPVLNLREALQKYVELSPSTLPFLTL
jgi:hypothetical protein